MSLGQQRASVSVTQKNVAEISSPVLEEILMTGYADGKSVPLHSSVSRTEGEFLQRIIRAIKPKVTLEVGLAFGVSALFIREALEPQSRYIAIDPIQHLERWQGLGLANLKRAGYGVDFYEQESQVVLPRLWAAGLKIDFAFIDGWHTFDHVLVDFFYIDKMLRPGGVIVLDDANYPSIHEVCRFILTNRSYSVYGTCEPTGEESYIRGQRWLLPTLRAVPLIRPHLISEQLQSDSDLGLGVEVARCVALVKQGDDIRSWNFHRPF